jgi:hypothetical protein
LNSFDEEYLSEPDYDSDGNQDDKQASTPNLSAIPLTYSDRETFKELLHIHHSNKINKLVLIYK